MSAADPHPTPEEAPERVYAWPDRPIPLRGKWSVHPAGQGALYVRGDLYYALAAEVATLRGERDTTHDCLRIVCHHLELPQSESGPCDDASAYDHALEAADRLYRETQAERDTHAKARWEAEAEVARLTDRLEESERNRNGFEGALRLTSDRAEAAEAELQRVREERDEARRREPTWPHIPTDTLIRQSRSAAYPSANGRPNFTSDTINALCDRLDALAAETATLRGERDEAIGKAARWQSACEEARAALAERGGEGEDEAEIAEARRMATIIEPTRMLYSNWRGETAQRRIIPIRLWLGSTEWHPEPGWLLRALDVDKDAMRDFALSDCTFRPATPSDHQRAVAEARPYPTNLSDEQLLAEWHDLDRLWHSGDIEGGGSPLEAIETQSESIEDEIKRRGITVPSALRHPEAGTGEGGTP